MEKLFNGLSVYIGIVGGILSSLLGKWDTLLWALAIIMVLDYITGVIKAVYMKKMSSEIGFRGILKKVTIIIIVMLANVVETLMGGNAAIRGIVIMFYIANEGISILENVAAVSQKMPDALKEILLQLRDGNEQ
jgi:toxin secretion/phage lysis holin